MIVNHHHHHHHLIAMINGAMTVLPALGDQLVKTLARDLPAGPGALSGSGRETT